MLALLISLISLLPLPKSTTFFWYLTPPYLIILTYLYMVKVLQYSSHYSMSQSWSMDIMSAALIILSLWITCLMLLASAKIKFTNNSTPIFYLTTLILLLILTMCFSSSNLMYFYIWFEASLVPTMFLIMVWGYQPERIQASMYLMMYTVTASLPFLMIIMMILRSCNLLIMWYPFLSLPMTLNPHLMYFALLFAFLVKLPLFLVHLWLPKAHVEAPVAGSMILAAILLKLGGYGLIRITLLFPHYVKLLTLQITSIALIGAISTSLICLRQTDLKSIIAYSSIGHMGLMCAGIMSLTSIGMQGALVMMIAHGLSSSALFCMCNITYESTHTRSLTLIGGTLNHNPMMTLWWFLLICMNMAAPPSINLMSEIMLIMASMSLSVFSLYPIMIMSFMNVAYSLFIYSKITHGHTLTWSNPTPLMSMNYNMLIIMHFLPSLLLILCPSIIT